MLSHVLYLCVLSWFARKERDDDSKSNTFASEKYQWVAFFVGLVCFVKNVLAFHYLGYKYWKWGWFHTHFLRSGKLLEYVFGWFEIIMLLELYHSSNYNVSRAG